MIRLYFWIILFNLGVFAQESAYQNVEPTLQECYENRYLLEKDNRLPHTLHTLITIIRKIENVTDGLNMDLRSVTVAILHRYRQDGIVENPAVLQQSGVLPYRLSYQGQKYLQIRQFITQKVNQLPYNIITDVERCTLHFMLSSSIEVYERHDESMVCRYADNAYRSARSVGRNHSTNANSDIDRDVETLTPEQIDIITNHKNGITDDGVDPNALYPELPPNHPKIARVLASKPRSKCPVENGVIKTDWGAVSIGSVIAGIAAGLQPEMVKLADVFPNEPPERRANLSELVDNKWLATVAGDLAEVVLMQGPTNEKLSVGLNGNWNSSALPRWYFLNSNENSNENSNYKLQFTTAEIRGDLDGLILANKVESIYTKVSTLKLSQILDMYYSPRGFLNSSIRACNRGTLFKTADFNSTMSLQAYTASLVLRDHLHTATIHDKVIEKFAVEAANELSGYVSSSMNKDLSCHDTDTTNFIDNVQFAVDLTIILDTTWPFDWIQPILAHLLESVKISRYNSQVTIMNGLDGNIIINTTSSILDFYYYNATRYSNGTGFNLPKSLEKLRTLQTKKLENERHDFGHAKSDIVLIIPYTSSLNSADKKYCIEEIKTMQEQVPDATLLILAYESKERWADLVNDPVNDLFSINSVSPQRPSSSLVGLISRIKEVPQRLINTQCGADYSVTGSSNSFIDYIEPATTVFYKLHPNYFFSSDSSHTSVIKIEGSGWGELKVCTSRNPIKINSTEDASVSCASINSNMHTVSFSCDDVGLIHLCQSFYMSITANSSVTNYQCTDINVCRFPHMIKYTVSYENLECVSSASISMLNIVVLIISVIYTFL
nr:PREDICTED: uncharacterized protein LOC105668157 [Linepithema humile]